MNRLSLPILDLSKAGKLLMLPDSFSKDRVISLPVFTSRKNILHVNIRVDAELEGQFVSTRVSFHALDSISFAGYGEEDAPAMGSVSLFDHHYRESDIKRSPSGYIGLVPDMKFGEQEEGRHVIPVAIYDGGFSRISEKRIFICVNEHTKLFANSLDRIDDGLWDAANVPQHSVFGWNHFARLLREEKMFLPFKYDNALLDIKSETAPIQLAEAVWQSIKKFR